MNRESIKILFAKMENRIWAIDNFLKSLLGSSLSDLRKNKKYNNSDSGICFILGTGPSLKMETRIAELKKYPTFTVNQFYRSELFDAVKPRYHVMIDPLFFNLDPEKPEDADTLNRIIEVAKRDDITMIFPIDAKKYINKYIGSTDNCVYVK